ncbi:MAG: HD domain-containing protein [Anaerolineaceae bacterium]|nr:HD domain-containing protein [Anaerolineaceae bacterium]
MMIQITRTYNNTLDITDFLGEIKAYPVEKSVLFLFSELINEEKMSGLLDVIQKEIPRLMVAGATAYNRNNYTDPDPNETYLLCTFLSFETSDVEFILSDMEQTNEWQAVRDTKDRLGSIKDAKGILLISSGTHTNTQLFLEKLHQAVPSIPIFGMTASYDQFATFEFPSFLLLSGKFYKNALMSVIFYGPELHIQTNEDFGWTPLGRKMTVTAVGPGNIVKEIDGEPAAAIYKRYLGLEIPQINPQNTCEFPLFKRSGDHNVARISSTAFADGSVRFGGLLNVGDEIRFSYGNPPDILNISEQIASRLVSFSPQAVFTIHCMNRVLFLRAEWMKEYESFKKVLPNFTALHGGSELFINESGGGELNSALVYAAFREGDAEETKPTDVQASADSSPAADIPLERRLLTFLDVTTHELEQLQENLSEEVERKTEEIIRQQDEVNQAHLHIVMALSNAIDAKDSYTNGHSRRVAQYAREIAKRYGYSEQQQDEVYMIGILHDVGKIGISDAIINKPGRLTDEEFAQIKTHPAIGAEILSAITEYPQIAYGAHWHHERYDGKGYPDGLSGEDIPEIAQIISVADAYDAMTSNRSYRSVMPQEKVRAEIEKGRGTQFSPRFADIMLEMIDEDSEYNLKGSGNLFNKLQR